MKTFVAILLMCWSFILGYAMSSYTCSQDKHHAKIQTPLPNIALAAYLTLPRDDKRDMLVYLNINNEVPSEAAKAIAQDWCAINKKTQRVCSNARMANPIRGAR